MGMIRGYIGGTFDLFHPGHVNLLARAKSKCSYLIVSLNTDEFAERYKRKPIMKLKERIAAVKACRFVDEVMINEGDEDSTIAIKKAVPHKIFHGNDWTGEGLLKQMNLTEEWLKRRGITMVYLPYTKSISTTEIIKRINERHLK